VNSAAMWMVTCAACELRWNRVGNLTEYERQAIESQPCPGCGSYTLSCRVPAFGKDVAQIKQIVQRQKAA
jgi:hypothetical protein